MILVAGVWEFRYGDEHGKYPKEGNQCIGWIRLILQRHNHSLTVADLRGDPEGKLKADGLMGGERGTDSDGIAAIKRRIREIEDITAETGESEPLEEEHAGLLHRLKVAMDEQRVTTPLKRDHHNIATQIRNFLRDKLDKDMPKLAAHLRAALKLDFPDFGYHPPRDTPGWKT